MYHLAVAGLHCYVAVYTCLSHSYNDKAHKAQVLDDAESKVISKGLPNLDAIADAKFWQLAWLDCSSTDMRGLECCKVQQYVYQMALSGCMPSGRHHWQEGVMPQELVSSSNQPQVEQQEQTLFHGSPVRLHVKQGDTMPSNQQHRL